MEYINTVAMHLDADRRQSRRRSRHTADELTAEDSLLVQRLAEQARQLEERQRRIEELEAANAELRMFAATAAHDLKSPLTTIIGFASLAMCELDKVHPESVRTCLRRVRSAAGRMSKLVSDLQELASQGLLVDELTDVSLAEVAKEAVEQLAIPAVERGIELDVAPGLPRVVGDRGGLTRVIQNLIENGIRYMGEQRRPRIEITARTDGGEVLCSVRDNGAGIAPHHRERIFQPFEKAEDSDGCGLGLHIVRRIVEAHGGRVWVESEGEGQGSSFRFTLRAAALDPLLQSGGHRRVAASC